MPRRRLGVALLVPEPAVAEVQGLRRACNDPALTSVPPHLTLVPPVNVAEDDLGDALALLRAQAATTAPLQLAIGPPATFLPEPVLYLAVRGSGLDLDLAAGHEVEALDDPHLDALLDLRDRVFHPPLARPLSHTFVPHVTLCTGATPEWILQAARTLVTFELEVEIDRLHLLEERRLEGGERVWVPIADAPFAPPAVVARGGLEVELTTTELVDPEGAAALPHGYDGSEAASEGPAGRHPLVVTARRDRAVLGVAVGWTSGDQAVLADLVVTKASEAGEDVAGHLRAAFTSEAATRGVLTFDDTSHPAHQGSPSAGPPTATSGDWDVSPEPPGAHKIHGAGDDR